jgi:DNA processing protein
MANTRENLILHVFIGQSVFPPRMLRHLYKLFGSYQAIWEMPIEKLPRYYRAVITEPRIIVFRKIRETIDLENENANLALQDIWLCSLVDQDYPKLLKHIHHPPVLLYCRGVINAPTPSAFCLAVVGSRKLSDYGRTCIGQIISGFSGLPISIISGLALGADACAHQQALNNSLHTVAVLGSGIDDLSIYPKSHYGLAQEIIKRGGGIISEYPPGTKAFPAFFPTRNRIIAGMCNALLVAEAGIKSGTFITAQSALEEGRDIWAIPGPITHSQSAGTNLLISQGAQVALNSESIIDAYLQLRGQGNKPSQLNIATPAQNSLFSSKLSKQILEFLAAGRLPMEEIFSRCKQPPNEVNQALISLELLGKISVAEGYCVLL